MDEYLENGAELGWLIDVGEKQVYVCRQQTPPEILENPVEVSGEPLLKGFVLRMNTLWGD